MTSLAVTGLAMAPTLSAQDLADFDYANLRFRGFGFHGGWIGPSTVDPTVAWGMRADLGFLGPGIRVTPAVGYWSSQMKAEEVRSLEESLERLVEAQIPGGADLDLGEIDRSDLVIGVDAHVLWSVELGFLTYVGAGAAAHILNGGGPAVDDTFVEDLLDSVTAGLNLHGGIEVPLDRVLRTYGEVRIEWLDDIWYPELRLGLQWMTGPNAPGEVGG